MLGRPMKEGQETKANDLKKWEEEEEEEEDRYV